MKDRHFGGLGFCKAKSWHKVHSQYWFALFLVLCLLLINILPGPYSSFICFFFSFCLFAFLAAKIGNSHCKVHILNDFSWGTHLSHRWSVPWEGMSQLDSRTMQQGWLPGHMVGVIRLLTASLGFLLISRHLHPHMSGDIPYLSGHLRELSCQVSLASLLKS